MTTNELESMLKEFAEEMRKTRHTNNDHLSEVIGELRLEHNDMKNAILEIQKNGIVLTNICNNVEKTLEVVKDELQTKQEKESERLTGFIKEVYSLPAVKYQAVNAKRLEDTETLAKDLRKISTKHEKWFFAGWVVFVATQIVLKYIPFS